MDGSDGYCTRSVLEGVSLSFLFPSLSFRAVFISIRPAMWSTGGCSVLVGVGCVVFCTELRSLWPSGG